MLFLLLGCLLGHLWLDRSKFSHSSLLICLSLWWLEGRARLPGACHSLLLLLQNLHSALMVPDRGPIRRVGWVSLCWELWRLRHLALITWCEAWERLWDGKVAAALGIVATDCYACRCCLEDMPIHEMIIIIIWGSTVHAGLWKVVPVASVLLDYQGLPLVSYKFIVLGLASHQLKHQLVILQWILDGLDD